MSLLKKNENIQLMKQFKDIAMTEKLANELNKKYLIVDQLFVAKMVQSKEKKGVLVHFGTWVGKTVTVVYTAMAMLQQKVVNNVVFTGTSTVFATNNFLNEQSTLGEYANISPGIQEFAKNKDKYSSGISCFRNKMSEEEIVAWKDYKKRETKQKKDETKKDETKANENNDSQEKTIENRRRSTRKPKTNKHRYKYIHARYVVCRPEHPVHGS